MRESEQMEARVTRGLALSTRNPWLETERDETDDWTGAMLGGRKRIALGDVGGVGDLSRLRTRLGIIGSRVMAIDHDSGSGGGGGGRRRAAVLVRRGQRR